MINRPTWSATARTGPMRKYMQLSIFACEGLICIIDNREGKEGDYSVITPAEAVERCKALNKSYRGTTRAQLSAIQKEMADQRTRGFQAMMECVREAKHMGDPTDPKVQAYWARHRSNRTITFSPQFSSISKDIGSEYLISSPELDVYTPPKKKQASLILPN